MKLRFQSIEYQRIKIKNKKSEITRVILKINEKSNIKKEWSLVFKWINFDWWKLKTHKLKEKKKIKQAQGNILNLG